MTLAGDVGKPARRARPAVGAVALSVSNMLRMGVQLAMLPILARLVGPSEYGLVALAVPFVLFCNMLADAGLSQALARKTDATPQIESTVFWLAGGLGFALSVFAAVAAWPLGLLMDQPRLPWLILALAPILTMSGFTAVANARVIREGRFGVFAGGDFLSTAAAAAAALTAAMNGAGAWSLVAQQLTLWVVKFLWVNLNARPRIRRYCRPSEVADLFRFGVHSIGSNLADFVARNLDNLIVGGVLGTLALGWYAMAYQIVRVPDLIVSGPLYLYVFTAMSRAANAGDRSPADLAVSAVRLAWTALAPIYVGLAIVAPLAVEVVLGDKWRPSALVMTHLSAAGFGFANCLLLAAIVMGLGRSHLQLRMAALSAVATIAVVATTARFGLEVLSLSLGAAIVAVALVYLAVVARALRIAPGRLVAAALPGAAGVVALVCGVEAVRLVSGHLPPLARLIAEIGAGGLAYVMAAGLVGHRRIVEDARAFGRAHAARA